MFEKKETKNIQELFNNLGLNDLDADDTEMITNMLCNDILKDFKNFKNQKSLNATCYIVTTNMAIYSQNYLFLKHILKLEKQNQEIIEQGKRDTEQNQKIIEQNQQIIDLLAKIESKQ